ncbi:type II secretion system protein N [Solimonas marina]|uniref:Type II secretion system protein N n=1 Tax=Solimonas marina TaxID=2714601 RepID=A0A969WAW6_9GAMM|nr:type II secretion system protein N [Solimonas marina]NKF23144.1 type II secretion system protein N [Solimonas marina]
MRKYYLIAAALTFVAGLILLAPAATLYGWIAPRLGGQVALAGVTGTVHEGDAAAVMVGGSPLLQDLHWHLSIGELLLGRLGVDLDSRGAVTLSGHVSRGFGALRASNLLVSSGLKPLLAVAGQAYAPIDGQASLDLKHLKLLGNWPSDADGTLRVQNLAWTLARDPLVLGDYQADIQRDGNDIVALVHTLGGPLDVNGDARAKSDHSYELHLQLRAKPDAPPLIVNLLHSLGQPDPQGYYHLRQQGKLQP